MSKNFEAKNVNLKSYENEYSDNGFWDKVMTVAKKAGKPVIKNALLLYYALQSKSVTGADKAKIVGALGYFILPIDLIADILPLVGFTDDAAVILFVLKMLYGKIDDWANQQADKKLKEWF